MSGSGAVWDHSRRGMADHVVIRAHPDLPEGFLPPDLDGRWYDRNQVPFRTEPGSEHGPFDAVAIPTGRFEVREYDGAIAEVWEFRP